MLKHVSIWGLGPHDEFAAELHPRGTTVVTGPSESGKTTLLDAILFALWGRGLHGRFPVEAIRDGHQRAVVELALDTGMTLRRSINRNRSISRAIVLGGTRNAYPSETAFQAALGQLGSDAEALHLVVAPLAWVPLVQANARPFRDVLSRILPDGDVVAEVQRTMLAAGYPVDDVEAQISEKKVGALRRDERKSRDELAGRVQAGEEAVRRLAASLPHEPTADVEAAREVLAHHAAWEAHARQGGGAEARMAAIRAQADWDGRREALGDPPEYEEGALEAATAAESEARRALKEAMQRFTEVNERHKAAADSLRELHLSGPTVCPTCERPGWTEGERVLARKEGEVAELKTELDLMLADGKACRAAHNAATEALAAAREARSAWAEFNSALRGLGRRPEVPEEAPGSDSAPDVPCPTPEAVDDARAAVDAFRRAEGAREQRQRDLAETRDRLERAQAAHGEAAREVARLEALLDAVRAAPSVVAARQAEALGDLGPVSLEFGDNPAVVVNIDGRPYWLASRGRQVVADLWLRAALRRALDMPWLPLVVDNSQDVGGQDLPEVGGPVIVMQTTNTARLSVVRKR